MTMCVNVDVKIQKASHISILHSVMAGFYTTLEIAALLESVCIIVIRDIVLRVACGSAKAVASDADSVLYLTQETSAGHANCITFCQRM
jgi:hypothetical protein